MSEQIYEYVELLFISLYRRLHLQTSKTHVLCRTSCNISSVLDFGLHIYSLDLLCYHLQLSPVTLQSPRAAHVSTVHVIGSAQTALAFFPAAAVVGPIERCDMG